MLGVSVTTTLLNPDENFCPRCGTLLPDTDEPRVQCELCHGHYMFKNTDVTVWSKTVTYNQGVVELTSEETKKGDGPMVNRTCVKCANEEMTYTTRQTRSADEGQTVFYTCTQCGHTEIDYS